MSKPLRCGFAAILDPAKSIHTETVLRALRIYQSLFAAKTIEFICCEDYGSLDGGAQAAEFLVSAGVDIVVGHYASNSALGALPLYAEQSIPMLLPTATDTCLTHDRNLVFRLCANNDNIVHALLSLFPSDVEVKFDVFSDESPYAKKLASILKSTLADYAPRLVQEAGASNIVFIGTGDRSAMFLQDCEDKGVSGNIILTDDAACAQLVIPQSMAVGQIHGIGFAPAKLVNPQAPCVHEYVKRYHAMPSVFFLETIAAFEIVSQLQAKSENLIADLNRCSFSTSLGELRFQQGENLLAPLCLWANSKAQQLHPIGMIKRPEGYLK
ncbi:ABC transporter substrate-binding protein [Serratia oryzae]|uniref:Uncharacterized protein n=1 Tax=Serratia oryzae TaxID=2034155 RepID=A0A1S8CQX1_9GAMM|nr:ABC transporter substrate-binding protein [Serratia oryzae]OMQ27063.1 hypothetical protein BMI79_01675 [Serratia oryzae]